MKKNTSIRCLATIIIFLLIGTSFVAVSARFIDDSQNESIILHEQRNGLEDNFFDITMSFLMNFAKFPSLSACIINNDQVIWSKGYGYYDIENQKESNPDTIYVIASITKTIMPARVLSAESACFSMSFLSEKGRSKRPGVSIN